MPWYRVWGVKREGLEWERGGADRGGQSPSFPPPKVCVCVGGGIPSSPNQGSDLRSQSLTFIPRSALCAKVWQTRISVPAPHAHLTPTLELQAVYEPFLLTHSQVYMTLTMRISP